MALSEGKVVRLGVFLLLTIGLLGCDTFDGDDGNPFPSGVASGDVTASRVVLWTRTERSAALTLEVATTPEFTGLPAFTQTVQPGAASDFTVKVSAEPLAPDTAYFYRWGQGDRRSPTGTFRTAPEATVARDVRFAFSGDTDGTLRSNLPVFNAFEVLDAVRREAPDFFVYLGDTIYADSPLRSSGAAESLPDYRGAYQENREIAALPALMQATAVYAAWDDHEVRNDFAGQTVNRALFRNGRQAFLEYMPVAEQGVPADPTCPAAPLFRHFRWGTAVELLVLDERSCRSASAAEVCQGDLAPTLPAALRLQRGQPAQPPAGCLEALNDPSRTMLGPVQKALFKEALRTSNATFVFVVNQVPIQQFWAVPYDRWEGYAAERTELLHFIRDHQRRNLIFLTTDTHANVINDVVVDTFREPGPVAQEFVTGPVATSTFEQEILLFFGPAGLENVHDLLRLAGTTCRELDTYAYGVVEVNAAARTSTITLKDQNGAVIRDQLNPAVVCQKTIGP